ncbi:MAG: hypothetical protein OCC45_03185 [Desulfotalea sp.]
MKISKSNIQQQSSHVLLKEHQKRESLAYWKTSEESKRGQALEILASKKAEVATSVSLSTASIALKSRPQKGITEPISEDKKPLSSLNILILQDMIERITGKKAQIFEPPAETCLCSEDGLEILSIDQEPDEVSIEPQTKAEFGLVYEYYESHYEYEQTQFSTTGIVTTEDGREISIAVEMNMSREFFQEESFSLKAGAALKDPLILNFNGNAAQLTKRNFSFDIDSDGQADQIAFVQPNSGFLALDKNGDNKINNGNELFGANTGDGFAELSVYDEDGNGWIDENDSVFDRLRIWMNSNGEQKLMALGAKGVGAIYLGHMDTPFALKDENNVLEGQVRSSGIFLNENGEVNTIQQVDLVA